MPGIYISQGPTNSYTPVSNSSISVIAANQNRQFANLTNDSAQVIYLALGSTAVLNSGIRLNAGGGSYEINMNNMYKGQVSAITTPSGSLNLCYVEGI